MNCDEAKARIDRYISSDQCQPIIVDAPNSKLYNDLVNYYSVGDNVLIETSSYTKKDGMPIMDKLQYRLSKANGVVFLKNLTPYLKIQGEYVLQRSLRSLLDLACNSKVVIITLNCAAVLKKMDSRLMSSGRVTIVDGDAQKQPTLYFISPNLSEFASASIDGIEGLGKMMSFLDNDNFTVCVVTGKSKHDFPNSMYDIEEYTSEYQVLKDRYTEFASFGEEVGTEAQWEYLLKELDEYDDWHTYISQFWGHCDNLGLAINTFNDLDNDKRWIYFLALRSCGAKGNKYLSYVVSKSHTFNNFISEAFCAILDFSVDDVCFKEYYSERKLIVSKMNDYSDELNCFCKRLYGKGDKAIYYLTDNTKQEKEMVVELIVKYDYNNDKLLDILENTYCDLATYIRPYNYQNTYLNRYFALYKRCKLTNRITDEFAEMVAEQSLKRQYNIWLQPRSVYVDKLEKVPNDSILFFIDALGAEFLGYLQNKCYESGLEFNADTARCNLPSITSFNKKFVTEFEDAGCKVQSVKDLDELKHGGVSTYNYADNKLPIHIVEELEILNGLVAQLKTLQNNQTAYVISDHGASRLAVIHETENKWEVAEKGMHSGRCCPKSDIDEKPDCATDENNFWCIANYDRFKGGRKAAVEVHGGATIEEVSVPIITVKKKNTSVTCNIDGTGVITVSFKKKARLRLFVDVDSDNLTASVNGIYYNLAKTESKYYYIVEMPDIKVAGKYIMIVYLDETIVADNIMFEVKKEGASERKFF